MQEVFEKIIEKLANLGWVFADYYPDGTNISRVSKKSVPCDEVVEIIKQAAEECKHGHFGCNSNGQHEKCSTCCDYDCKNRNREWFGLKDDNNGWIPCSERLPNEEEYIKDDGRFIVTDGNIAYQSIYDIYARVFRTLIANPFNSSYKYEHDKCLIAWQPLPATYKQTRGNEKHELSMFDRIRSMSAEEFAEFWLKHCDNPIMEFNEDICDLCDIYESSEQCDDEYCKNAIVKWLQSEVEE